MLGLYGGSGKLVEQTRKARLDWKDCRRKRPELTGPAWTKLGLKRANPRQAEPTTAKTRSSLSAGRES
jgi:hypothetical protein